MKNAKILILESERIIAMDIQKKLKKIGYHVAIASVSSIREVIDKILEVCPNLLIINTKLKEEDIIESIKQICTCLNIPIIYLTTCSYDCGVEQPKVPKPFLCLLKPFKAEELYHAVEASLTS